MSEARDRPRDTLGRAGRTGENGGRVETARARSMTPEDERRVRVDGRATVGVTFEDESIVYTPEDVPAAASDEHRGLQYLDGRSEPRPPKHWEEREAAHRSGVFAGERAAMTRDLKRSREALPLGQQLALAQQALLVIQSTRAKQTRLTDAKGAAESESAAPNGGRHGDVGHSDPQEIDRHLRQIALHIEAVWEHIDEHHGREHRSYALMSAEDKDRLITGPKFRGLSPEQIVAIRPEFGPAKAVRNVRKLNEQDPRGNPEKRAAS